MEGWCKLMIDWPHVSCLLARSWIETLVPAALLVSKGSSSQTVFWRHHPRHGWERSGGSEVLPPEAASSWALLGKAPRALRAAGPRRMERRKADAPGTRGWGRWGACWQWLCVVHGQRRRASRVVLLGGQAYPPLWGAMAVEWGGCCWWQAGGIGGAGDGNSIGDTEMEGGVLFWTRQLFDYKRGGGWTWTGQHYVKPPVRVGGDSSCASEYVFLGAAVVARSAVPQHHHQAGQYAARFYKATGDRQISCKSNPDMWQETGHKCKA